MKLLKTLALLLLTSCTNQYPVPFTDGAKTLPPIGCMGTKNICLIEPIFNNLKEKWVFKEDIEIYGEIEHWASLQEIEKNNFSGDCEDFAIYARIELAKVGIRSRLVLVRIKGIGGHIIVITESGYILDSLQNNVAVIYDLWNYELISQSGFMAGDDWHKI